MSLLTVCIAQSSQLHIKLIFSLTEWHGYIFYAEKSCSSAVLLRNYVAAKLQQSGINCILDAAKMLKMFLCPIAIVLNFAKLSEWKCSHFLVFHWWSHSSVRHFFHNLLVCARTCTRILGIRLHYYLLEYIYWYGECLNCLHMSVKLELGENISTWQGLAGTHSHGISSGPKQLMLIWKPCHITHPSAKYSLHNYLRKKCSNEACQGFG